MQSYKRSPATREQVEQMLARTQELLVREEKNGRKPYYRILKALSNILYALLIALLVGVLVWVSYLRAQGQTPSLFGYRLFVIQSESMEPALPVGSVILVKGLEPDQVVKVGDVVTFQARTAVVTHRVIETGRSEDGLLQYRTQGDSALNGPDPGWLEREDILGLMIYRVMTPER